MKGDRTMQYLLSHLKELEIRLVSKCDQNYSVTQILYKNTRIIQPC